MSERQVSLGQFDGWLQDDSQVAALVMRQWLEPVEGKDAIIFPPTYLKPERMRDEDWPGYNMDRMPDGSYVCQIDSVGSQANRIEPLFKNGDCSKLVPQVIIKAGEREVNLLEAGHRAADAIVRLSTLKKDLNDSFTAFQKDGNAEPLAKIAPTSIVFGSWDSRETQAKLPRIVRSVIRAFNVQYLHRSATYAPPIDYVNQGLVAEPANKSDQDRLSQIGLLHNPASWSHGGVQVVGGIRRDAALNLSAVRALKGRDKDKDTTALRRYILGLALVSFTATQDMFLREGCQLVPDRGRPAEWRLVRHDGSRDAFELSHQDAIRYAQLAAESFGVGPDRMGTFDSKLAKTVLSQKKGRSKKATEDAQEQDTGETQ